jgi:putative transposase
MQNRLGKLHAKIASIRNDFWHKITTQLCRENQAIGIETLNVSGMLKNRKLSKAISDAGFYEFRRQLSYKSKIYDNLIVAASQWYPSSKTCSNCGCVKESLTLAERVFHCEHCGYEEDRDVNAATNLRNLAQEEYRRLDGNLRLGREQAVGGLVEPRTKPCSLVNTN